MASKKQKTQAEKTASAANVKKKNTADGKKNAVQKQGEEITQLPVRLISSVVFLALSVLFAVILFSSEGALLKFLENVIHGVIGRTCFIVSIPVLLYLFFIHAFSGKRPVKFRTFSG